jgi:hypothetical protein
MLILGEGKKLQWVRSFILSEKNTARMITIEWNTAIHYTQISSTIVSWNPGRLVLLKYQLLLVGCFEWSIRKIRKQRREKERERGDGRHDRRLISKHKRLSKDIKAEHKFKSGRSFSSSLFSPFHPLGGSSPCITTLQCSSEWSKFPKL